LNLTIRQVGDVTIVDAAGRIVMGEAASSFRDAIHGLTVAGHKKVLVNLADVAYIDSSGMGEMVSGYTTLVKQGGVLKLLKLNKRVYELLQVAKVHTIFEVHDDEAKALASFQ
jgi:anti-sigma B factor antagonist